jgi:hypothetical protein
MLILAMHSMVLSTTGAETKGGPEAYVVAHARAEIEVEEGLVWLDSHGPPQAFSLASCCTFWGLFNTLKRYAVRVGTNREVYFLSNT